MPEVEELDSEIRSRGGDWVVYCDRRRARLNSRYIPRDKIKINE